MFSFGDLRSIAHAAHDDPSLAGALVWVVRHAPPGEYARWRDYALDVLEGVEGDATRSVRDVMAFVLAGADTLIALVGAAQRQLSRIEYRLTRQDLDLFLAALTRRAVTGVEDPQVARPGIYVDFDDGLVEVSDVFETSDFFPGLLCELDVWEILPEEVTAPDGIELVVSSGEPMGYACDPLFPSLVGAGCFDDVSEGRARVERALHASVDTRSVPASVSVPALSLHRASWVIEGDLEVDGVLEIGDGATLRVEGELRAGAVDLCSRSSLEVTGAIDARVVHVGGVVFHAMAGEPSSADVLGYVMTPPPAPEVNLRARSLHTTLLVTDDGVGVRAGLTGVHLFCGAEARERLTEALPSEWSLEDFDEDPIVLAVHACAHDLLDPLSLLDATRRS